MPRGALPFFTSSDRCAAIGCTGVCCLPRIGQALVVGPPNAGKTLFVINFAEYLGARAIRLRTAVAAGEKEEAVRYVPAAARRALVGAGAHTTLQPQAITVSIARGKLRRSVELWDSTGLTDTVHPAPAVRQGQGATLQRLLEAALVLHLVDAAAYAGTGAVLSQVDAQVVALGCCLPGYAVLANKLDLADAPTGFVNLQRLLPECTLIPVSALTGRGFAEVKRFVRRHL